jgi:hypothetical protein
MKFKIILVILLFIIYNGKLFDFLQQNNYNENLEKSDSNVQYIYEDSSEMGIDPGTFEEFDQDKDGFITKDEFIENFKNFGGILEKEEADKMIDPYDVDKDGKLSYEEFSKMMSSPIE